MYNRKNLFSSHTKITTISKVTATIIIKAATMPQQSAQATEFTTLNKIKQKFNESHTAEIKKH